MNDDTIRVGIFGVGTVGAGVIELLSENRTVIEKRAGKPVKAVKAVVADIGKKRAVDMSQIELSDRPESILDDPEIDIVVELIGGLDLSETIILDALEKGKSVVTANKALLAEKSMSIFPAAYRANGCFGFEASVGAGIPVIRTLREGFSGDRIITISGIMNGTANYILTRMTEDEMEFDQALKGAQELGYAEADPTFDIEGIDTAHKLIILMNLAYNGLFNFKDLKTEGISSITSADIRFARELGYRIKLLGKACHTGQGVEGRVHPALVPEGHIMASVNGAFNAISVTGNYVGPSVLHGLGAGSHPTAAAVVSDLIEASRYHTTGQQTPLFPFSVAEDQLQPLKMVPMEDIRSEYYLRFNVQDQVGVLARISKILAENNISIRSVIQKGRTSDPASTVAVIIVTHESLEKDIQKALLSTNQLDFVVSRTQLIRIEPD